MRQNYIKKLLNDDTRSTEKDKRSIRRTFVDFVSGEFIFDKNNSDL